MKGTIKISLYEVEHTGTSDITSVCDRLGSLPLDRRLVLVNGYDTRMESLERPKSGILIADFCKQRVHGPGRSSKNEITMSFDMEQDENFGELTSILLTPDRKYALVQYNHYGPRAPAIAEYLSQHMQGEDEVSFTPVLERNLLHKIAHANSVSWVEAKFNFSYADQLPAQFQDEPFDKIYGIMNSFDSDNAGRIEVKVSRSRRNSHGMNIGKAKDFLHKAVALYDDGIVNSAKVEVIREDDTHELLDLIRGKEEVEVVAEWDSLKSRMIPFNVRNLALTQAYIHWRNKSLIQ